MSMVLIPSEHFDLLIQPIERYVEVDNREAMSMLVNAFCEYLEFYCQDKLFDDLYRSLADYYFYSDIPLELMKQTFFNAAPHFVPHFLDTGVNLKTICIDVYGCPRLDPRVALVLRGHRPYELH